MIFGVFVQLDSSSVARLILDESFSRVSIDRFYLANFSVISVGTDLFLAGCFVVLIEYAFLKLNKLKNEKGR